jgi:class 3 adenylate cyclase
LNGEFIAALLGDFRHGGPAAIAKVRKNQPAAYCKLLTLLCPRPDTGAGMVEQRVQRRLAAILAGDVAGYSRLMGADEEGTLSRLNVHRREFLESKIADHRGRIVKRTGDGVLIEFASAVHATRCAVEIHALVKPR